MLPSDGRHAQPLKRLSIWLRSRRSSFGFDSTKSEIISVFIVKKPRGFSVRGGIFLVVEPGDRWFGRWKFWQIICLRQATALPIRWEDLVAAWPKRDRKPMVKTANSIKK